jgi:hypothetical protein
MKTLWLALSILGSTSAMARSYGFGWVCTAPNVNIAGYPVFSRAYTREVAYGEIENKCSLYHLTCEISCQIMNF